MAEDLPITNLFVHMCVPCVTVVVKSNLIWISSSCMHYYTLFTCNQDFGLISIM